MAGSDRSRVGHVVAHVSGTPTCSRSDETRGQVLVTTTLHGALRVM
jgi:hypothetical protein